MISTVSADGPATMGAGHQQAKSEDHIRKHNTGTTMSSKVHADTENLTNTIQLGNQHCVRRWPGNHGPVHPQAQ